MQRPFPFPFAVDWGTESPSRFFFVKSKPMVSLKRSHTQRQALVYSKVKL